MAKRDAKTSLELAAKRAKAASEKPATPEEEAEPIELGHEYYFEQLDRPDGLYLRIVGDRSIKLIGGSPLDTSATPLPNPSVPTQSQPPKGRSRREAIRAAINQKWGPDWPPDTLPTPEALRELNHELDRLGITASDDTKKRAMGRRD
jgi:hypothetical protein